MRASPKPEDVILTVLRARAGELNGRTCSEHELQLIQATVPLPPWFIPAMREFRLAGACFALPRPDPDVIGFGDAMRWLTPQGILNEAHDDGSNPSLFSSHMLPIGLGFYKLPNGQFVQIADVNCIKIDIPDPPIMNISHETGPDPDGDLLVAEALSLFLASAKIVSPPS